jgi:putative SOS response-associated peptidase YedK
MCGRYTLATPWKRLAEKFGLRMADVPELFANHYNIAPSQPVLAVGPDRSGQPAPAFFRWGLVPAWASNPKQAPINARAETAASGAVFGEALRRRRCLIVADGFYEWQRLKPGKQPWHFRMADGSPFAFAGLWDSWRPTEKSAPLLTCALLTVRANEVVKPIHNRMPAILRPEHYAAWIDRANDDPAAVLPLVRPYAAEEMAAVAVGPFVNDAKHDGPECVAATAPTPIRDDPLLFDFEE